ncbi:hypothetical protein M758_UG172500, partial [Ceratodon purpureus]
AYIFHSGHVKVGIPQTKSAFRLESCRDARVTGLKAQFCTPDSVPVAVDILSLSHSPKGGSSANSKGKFGRLDPSRPWCLDRHLERLALLVSTCGWY